MDESVLDGTWDKLNGTTVQTTLTAILIDKIHTKETAAGARSARDCIRSLARMFKAKFPAFNLSFEPFSESNPRPACLSTRLVWEEKQGRNARYMCEKVLDWLREKAALEREARIESGEVGGRVVAIKMVSIEDWGVYGRVSGGWRGTGGD